MMTDPIADMLTRIRNAQAVGKTTVVLPSSKMKRAVAEILAREGWLARVEVRPVSRGAQRANRASSEELVLTLRYRRAGVPWIANISRVSTPGQRVYIGRGAIPRGKKESKMLIISTPQGLLTNREALERGVGGEVICEVY